MGLLDALLADLISLVLYIRLNRQPEVFAGTTGLELDLGQRDQFLVRALLDILAVRPVLPGPGVVPLVLQALKPYRPLPFPGLLVNPTMSDARSVLGYFVV